jgi:hypothetical protein
MRDTVQRIVSRLRPPPSRRQYDERGMTTAELLGNAALGVAALVVIWAALQALGVHIVSWIGKQIGV